MIQHRYASGATIQVLLFGVIAINLKKVAPSAHTVAEIVNARWGRTAHITFLFFCFAANTIVTAMLLLGGAATVEALTGMSYELAAFLIPWGVILYTAAGGLQATFLASYLHTVRPMSILVSTLISPYLFQSIIFGVLITMIFLVYIKAYSSDQVYDLLQNTINKTEQECKDIWSYGEGHADAGKSFYGTLEDRNYSCGPIDGNREGSYLTMISSGGLMFGIINIIGNFGTVFVDQSYWQSAIAARPSSAARGYLLGG
jgi:urea-proton symporter